MPKLTAVKPGKILSFAEFSEIIEEDRQNGLRIIQCHGVFDLIHPGHIRHFKEAKTLGDRLVVTVTPDRFVNKGPGRPVFHESLRLETLAALEDIDYVILNDSLDAVSAIQRVRPHFYVKGMEYSHASDDVTGKILEEKKAVEAVGGSIYYTNDIVFSSSSLLNRYFDPHPPPVREFLARLGKAHSASEMIEKIEALSDLKVVVIGDAIIDEYQYAMPLGQSGKGLHMVARCQEKETFLGGSLIIANHIAQYARAVTLLTALGRECPYLNLIRQSLDPKVTLRPVYLEETTSLMKKRYVFKDGNAITKLFETYSGHERSLNRLQSSQIIKWLQQEPCDLLLVCDFGNGFTNPEITYAVCDLDSFLALNVQTNSGNRGFNVVTNYQRADYISVNETELRLSAHDRESSLEGIAADICQIMHCKTLSITKGIHGALCYSHPHTFVEVPAFANHSIDRMGAGDCYLSLSSLCLAKGYSPLLASFVGSIAAAMSVQMVGNQEAIKKASLCKFVTRLMK